MFVDFYKNTSAKNIKDSLMPGRTSLNVNITKYLQTRYEWFIEFLYQIRRLYFVQSNLYNIYFLKILKKFLWCFSMRRAITLYYWRKIQSTKNLNVHINIYLYINVQTLDQKLDCVKCLYCLQARYTTRPDYLKISMVHATKPTLKS